MATKPVKTGRTEEMEMFQIIMDEIRHIRQRLDDHLTEETAAFELIRQEIARVREDLAVHKTRLGVVTGGIAVFIAAVVSLVVDAFKK